MIEVVQDGKKRHLPDAKAIAARSRCDAANEKQRPRREREHKARCRAVDFAASMKTEGIPYCRAAKRLSLNPRTLANWCCQRQKGELTCNSRGRRCKESPFLKRFAVAEFLQGTIPYIGIPAICKAFPKMPPGELTDMRRDYWKVYRHHNRVVQEKLTWHFPGRVWAVDHTHPPSPVDGIYPKMFAVRDLASGMELEWQPVPDETALTTRDALLALFVEFGPPLVLKSDNGPAFKAEVIDLLKDWLVVPLLSPPETPWYNGSREAGIGGLTNHTHYQAALAGHPGIWTSEDVEAARRHHNELPGHRYQHTALELWQSRIPIGQLERKQFRLTVDRIRVQMEEEIDPMSREALTKADMAAIERRVVRQALEEFGLLSSTWRSITLPIKPRKRARNS